MSEQKTFLITGGAGFIGSHLVDRLLAHGQRVLVIDDLSSGRWSNIAHHRHSPAFHFARASIMDEIVLDRLASEANVIVHLAAAVGVKRIVENPVYTIETNITGSERVLKAALRYGCRTLIASTSEVYGKGSRIPFREDDDVLLGPTSKNRWAYAASKMVDEFLGFAYVREYGADVVVARLFNTVGPRQSGEYGMVVPRFVRQALAGAPITIHGDGEQSRCFCDVGDVVRALLLLVDAPAATGQTFNIGSSHEVTIKALAQQIIAQVGSNSPLHFIPYEQAYAPGFEDMRRRVPDTGRIHALTGWQPEIALAETLARVIAHERSAPEGVA